MVRGYPAWPQLASGIDPLCDETACYYISKPEFEGDSLEQLNDLNWYLAVVDVQKSTSEFCRFRIAQLTTQWRSQDFGKTITMLSDGERNAAPCTRLCLSCKDLRRKEVLQRSSHKRTSLSGPGKLGRRYGQQKFHQRLVEIGIPRFYDALREIG